MEAGRVEAINDLLVQAEEAHGRYEATELNGVYDQDWPRWYAAYAVEHGLGALLDHDVGTDRVAEVLANTYTEFEQTDPKPSVPWATFIARRMAADL